MKMRIFLILISITIAGCSFFGKKAVTEIIPRRQIDYDLSNDPKNGNSVKLRSMALEGSWMYSEDELRCFAPSGDTDKITDSTADISLNIGAVNKPFGSDRSILYGKILLHYKKENDAWKLESLDSKNLRRDSIPVAMKDEMSKVFKEKIEPLCSYYIFTTAPVK